MSQSKNSADYSTEHKEDRQGEAEKRDRIRALFGENKKINGSYDETLSAKCHNGTFVGKSCEDVVAFKGIPFAKPPVNELRWKSPQPADDDDGVYEAYYHGCSPIQTEWPSEEGSYYPQSENCLTLNVWSAKTNDGFGKDKAVMVFFHGGSYGWGATVDPIYNGHNLVSKNRDIVLITAEYRTGIMGFIDFSEVEGSEDFKTSGNLGLLDHLCALEWIRKNVESFGGNKDNITIFGESAGGGTVSLLPLLPESRGLFKRVIAESGSVALTYSKEECLPLAKRLLEATGKKNMAELMALSEDELKAANESLNDYNNFPERDGIVLPEDLYGTYESGRTADYDFMTGTNADEVRYWIREMGYYSKGWLGPLIFKVGAPVMFKSNMARVEKKDIKHVKKFMSLFSFRKLWKIVEFNNDILFRVPAIKEASEHSKNGGKAYMYYWTYPSAHKGLGACHAVELAYVFGNTDVTIYTGDNIDENLAQEVQKMWVNFAKYGDPSTENYEWNQYDEATRTTAMLGEKIHFVNDPMSERRKSVEPLLKYYFNGCYTNLKLSNVPFIYKVAAVLLAIISIVPAIILVIIRLIKKLVLCGVMKRGK